MVFLFCRFSRDIFSVAAADKVQQHIARIQTKSLRNAAAVCRKEYTKFYAFFLPECGCIYHQSRAKAGMKKPND